MEQKRALITGITGQDGSYLAELLLEKGYEVHGMIRRSAIEDGQNRLSRIKHIYDKLCIHNGTLESYQSIINTVIAARPHECYHLAAQSDVAYSFRDSFATMKTNIEGTHNVLEALRLFAPKCRLYFAASSEMFGKVLETPQNEQTPFYPRSPYGISKVAGYHLVRNYREAYNMFACSGILYNHESERRGCEFVTRKITRAVANIKYGAQREVRLGNIDAKRDWGHSKDYVYAQWLMLQKEQPDDFVIATGRTHTVRDFLKIAFNVVGLAWEQYVVIDPNFYRPAEVEVLLGDAAKGRRELGWFPNISFEKLVQDMVNADIAFVKGAIGYE